MRARERSRIGKSFLPLQLTDETDRPPYSFFSAHFASAASCFFFGSFRCSSQRNRNRGPFERFLQPGYLQLMSRFSLRSLLPNPSRPVRLGNGSAAEMRSAKIWAKRSARRSKGCAERLGIG